MPTDNIILFISVHSTENDFEHIYVLNLYMEVKVSSEIIMAEALKEGEEIKKRKKFKVRNFQFCLLSGFFSPN